MISEADKQDMLDACIHALHQEVLNGAANTKVASAKELLSLLSAKENMSNEKTREDRPLFGDLFKWRKVKEV